MQEAGRARDRAGLPSDDISSAVQQDDNVDGGHANGPDHEQRESNRLEALVLWAAVRAVGAADGEIRREVGDVARVRVIREIRDAIPRL